MMDIADGIADSAVPTRCRRRSADHPLLERTSAAALDAELIVEI
jgi:hypothetical protein